MLYMYRMFTTLCLCVYVFGILGFFTKPSNQLFFHFLFTAFWKLTSWRTADSSMLNVFNFTTGREDYSDYVIDFTPYNQIIRKY